jgi:WD40 repeat protein
MLLLLLAVLQASTTAIDVSTLKVAPPTTIAELDLGKLKGELRQLGWSPDGTELYIQTADGNPGSEKLRHYTVAVAGGAVKPLDLQPEWASSFWGFKSARNAPGLASLQIDVEHKLENTKVGTSSGRPGEQAAGPGGGNVSIDKVAESQHQNVIRLTLFGEAVGEFVNQQAIPGLTFSWGPTSSGAIAYTEREGRLMLLDRNGHKQHIGAAKDALLPAWSPDGTRLAWVQKTGRKKYSLVWAPVAR